MTFIPSSTGPAQVSSGNSTTTPLADGATFTGSWEDVTGYASIVISCRVEPTNADGVLQLELSDDGVTVDNVLSWAVTNGTVGVPRFISPSRAFVRVKYVDAADAVAQSVLRIKTILHPASKANLPTSRFSQAVNDDSDVLNTRAILVGKKTGGDYANVDLDPQGHLQVTIGDRNAYSQLEVVEETPITQTDSVWGVPTGAFVTTKTENGGSVAGSTAGILITSGTNAAGMARLYSKRVLNYRDGQSGVARFLASFDTPIADNLQFLGVTSHGEDSFFVGLFGTSFGIARIQGAVREVQTLTVSAGTGGAPETITITLEGVATPIAAGSGLSAIQVASLIATQSFATVGGGWIAVAVGNTVEFVRDVVGDATGAFTMASTGSAAGTFAESATGDSGSVTFTPQASFSIDPLDGTGPSGIDIDPTKLNSYEITISTDQVIFFLRDPGHLFQKVPFHAISVLNVAGIPIAGNPTMNLAVMNTNDGNTSSRSITLISMSAFIAGRLRRIGARRGFSGSKSGVATAFVPIISIRPRGKYGSPSRAYNGETYVPFVSGACLTANRNVEIGIILNASLTAAQWTAVDANGAIVYDTSATGYTGGILLATFITGIGGEKTVDLSALDLIAFEGDSITIVGRAISSTSDIAASLSWIEDR